MIRGNNTGERIKNRREELGLSQTELAKRMGYSSKSAVSRTENAGDDVGTTRVYKFASALRCSPSELTGWTEEGAKKDNFDNFFEGNEQLISTMARFREVLWESRMSAQELADNAKISESLINQYVNGKNTPSASIAQKIVDCLTVKVNPAWLMGLDVDKRPPTESGDITIDIEHIEKLMEGLEQDDLQRLKCYAEYLIVKNEHKK